MMHRMGKLLMMLHMGKLLGSRTHIRHNSLVKFGVVGGVKSCACRMHSLRWEDGDRGKHVILHALGREDRDCHAPPRSTLICFASSSAVSTPFPASESHAAAVLLPIGLGEPLLDLFLQGGEESGHIPGSADGSCRRTRRRNLCRPPLLLFSPSHPLSPSFLIPRRPSRHGRGAPSPAPSTTHHCARS